MCIARQLIENLSMACHTVLGNLLEADEAGPHIEAEVMLADAEMHVDYPQDADGTLWFQDVWDLKQAVEAIDAELQANPAVSSSEGQ